MVYLQTTYELCFGEAYFEYFESCDFSRENTNIDVSVFIFDLRMINMSSECEYDWYWKILACSTEYEVCDSFVSLTRHQTSYSGSAGWYFRYQSIHIQITYTYLLVPLLFQKWYSSILVWTGIYFTECFRLPLPNVKNTHVCKWHIKKEENYVTKPYQYKSKSQMRTISMIWILKERNLIIVNINCSTR